MPHIFNNAKTKRLRKYQRKKNVRHNKKKKGNVRKRLTAYRIACLPIFFRPTTQTKGHS